MAMRSRSPTRSTNSAVARPRGPLSSRRFRARLAQQNQGGSGSVLLVPLPKRNAIMLFGPDLRFKYYEGLIEKLDLPNSNGLVEIQLKKASAQQVAQQLTTFYASRYPNQTDNLIRFTYNTATNAIYVQAGPADMKEIQSLVALFEKPSGARNELRIYQLKNTLSTDIANTLQAALFQNILPQGTGIVQQTAGAPGAANALAPGGALGFGGAFGGGGAFGAGGALGGGRSAQRRHRGDAGHHWLTGHQHDQVRVAAVPRSRKGRDL